jgi:acetyl-CoA carboxylase biotin carboxyl carrier protein
MGEKEKVEKSKPARATSSNATALSVSDIRELFGLMKTNEIAELYLKQHGTEIRIVSASQHVPQQPIHNMVPMMPQSLPAPAPAAQAPAQSAERSPEAPAAPPAAAPGEALPENLKTICSPMVGTFYRAPAPEASPFVHVGDRVSEDSTLCIIEAMKLMNELKAEMKGRIYKILVENGLPVEYNQPLFLIQPE